MEYIEKKNKLDVLSKPIERLANVLNRLEKNVKAAQQTTEKGSQHAALTSAVTKAAGSTMTS